MGTAKIILPLIAAMAAVACDDGPVRESLAGGYTADALTVRFTGTVTGTGTWPDGYSVVVAGFADSDFAVISKPVDDGDGLELAGITPDITAVELCVVNRLRKRVATYASTAPAAGADGFITLAAGEVDAGMYNTVQTTLFDASCVQCHGGSNHAAAGLDLTAGRSYGELVGVASEKSPSQLRVAAGDAGASVLWQALATDVSEQWAYRHHTILSNAASADLIKDWIDCGAKNDLP